MANIFTKIYSLVDGTLESRLQALQKGEEPATEDLSKGERHDGLIGRKGLLFDPAMDQANSSGLYKPKINFLAPLVLQQVSRKNSIVASVIDLRGNQVAAACKKPIDRFDVGFQITPKDSDIQPDPKEIREIEEFIINCGKKEDRAPEDKMTFDQWGYMVARDFQLYGHSPIEKVHTTSGDLHSFLPLPGESIFYADKNATAEQIKQLSETYKKTYDKDSQQVKQLDHSDEIKFVQVIDGKVVEGFTEKELTFARYVLESDIALNGYCVGPLERAIGAIISHLQIENHQKQFFTHGTASKGVLVIRGDVSPNTLKALQQQWNNQITGPVNAWRTPILAGIEGADWLSLTASNRDMEYAAWQDYVLRVVFSCFAVDPEEVGFGYLSKGTDQKSMGESSNEWKITASRDRGLRPLLNRIAAIINEDILPALNPEYSKKYDFSFVGLDAETRAEELQRQQIETTIHTTLKEAREESDKDPLEFGNNIILNPLYIQTLQMNMTKGDFMEKIIGIEGASQRPDLQFIPDPMWFQWQQIQMQMMQQQAMGGQGGPGGDMQNSEDPQQPTDAAGQQAQENMSPEDQAAQEQAQQQAEANASAGGQPQQGQPQQGGGEGQQMTPEQQQQMQMQQQAMAQSVNMYMQQNPQLFKAMRAVKQQDEDLKKAQYVQKKIRNTHVEDMTGKLVKDFRKASDHLVKEIMEEIRKDLKDQE